MTEKNSNSPLEEYRERIAEIDRQICGLFVKRLETAGLIAQYKKENNLPVYDPVQERKRMSDIVDQVPADLQEYFSRLYGMVFEISKDFQRKQIDHS